jgi:sulfite exporter TauE/SafE
MIEQYPQLIAALTAGLLGSAHCFAMCSGISGLIAVNSSVNALSTQLPLAVAYNAGRVISYALLGAIVAAFGAAIFSSIPGAATPVRIVGGLVIILVGLQIAFDIKLLAPLEQAGSVLWAKIAPAAKRLVPVRSLPAALALGLLWGWLPCGLVYSMLLLAAASGNAADGALVMTFFGLGTLPAMILTGVGTLQLSRLTRNSSVRTAAGLLLIVLGALTLAAPIRGLFYNSDNHYHSPRIQSR